MTDQSPNHLRQDQNFDGRVERFQKQIYGSLKGDIRLHILWRDLSEQLDLDNRTAPLRILDAGGGLGQISLRLAKLGHEVVVSDISQDMCVAAREAFIADKVDTRARFIHSSIQDLHSHGLGQFDVVLCHAVLEWLAEPRDIACLKTFLKPQGLLSLAFYNKNAITFRLLTRAHFAKVQAQDYAGMQGGFTPLSPLLPETVFAWLDEWAYSRVAHSGMRMFYDHMEKAIRNSVDPDEMIAMELQHSRIEPFRSMARYIHVMATC